MSVLKAVVVCLALLLAAETTTDAQVTKYDTSKGSFRSDDDANTSKSSEERDVWLSAFEKNLSVLDKMKQTWWAWQKRPAEKVFRGQKLAENVPRLFDNPKFYKWLVYTKKRTSDDWASLLMQNTKPDTLTTAIFAGMESGNEYVRKFAHDLQQKRYEAWQKDKAPLSVVFKNLGLDNGDLLSTPAFKHWREYYKGQFEAIGDDLAKGMQSDLQEIVKSPADLLNELVVATMNEDAQIRELVEVLGLDKGEFVSNPAFIYWRDYYRERFKATDDDLVNALQPALQKMVNSPADLINGLVAAATTDKDAHTQELAKKLIHKIWSEEGKPFRINKGLELEKGNLFSNPAFRFWRESYLKHITDDDLVKELVPALEQILENPANLINGLAVAATTDKDAHVQVLAKKLIRRVWVDLKDPINIVKSFGLEKGDLFSNPAFRYWREYFMEHFTDDGLVNALVPVLHELVENPADLINGLVVAATTDKDKHIQVLAEKLIHKIWREQPAKPSELVKSLKLSKDGFLSNPALPIWINYCRARFRFEKGDFFRVLRTNGGYAVIKAIVHGKEDPSTRKMATILFDDMVDYHSAMDPKDRMKELFGDSFGVYVQPTLSSPKYIVWKAAALKSTTPLEEEVSIFVKELREAFTDANILRTITHSIGKPPNPQGFDEMVERHFLTQLAQGDEKKYEAVERMVSETPRFHDLYWKRIVAEREKWLKQSHEK